MLNKTQKIFLLLVFIIFAYIFEEELTKTDFPPYTYQTLIVSENIIYGKVDIRLRDIGHATTYLKVFSIINSPYLKNFSINMSMDNKTWVESTLSVKPLNCSNVTNTTDFSFIGFINLNQLKIPFARVYTLSLIKPQKIPVPEGVTKEDVLNSVFVCTRTQPWLTSNDVALRFVLFITLLGLPILIIEFLFRN